MPNYQEGSRIQVKSTLTGNSYEYVWKGQPPEGGMKIVYFAPDKSYVVAFYKASADANAIARLEDIVGIYRKRILEQVGGEYWRHVYCWPYDVIRGDDGQGHSDWVGIIVPTYPKQFFFSHDGSIPLKGEEKVGKWFTSPAHHFGLLSDKEIGDWRCYFNICLLLARGVRRMHLAGLAHSDLSYKNVLIDPVTQSAAIIDIDGLVVPGKYPPDVLGTPDFIAPEVYETIRLPQNKRKLPCRTTDLHALAVLIYMYLLCRHPLRGKKVWDIDDQQRDEMLAMGEKALFIEHPTDRTNRYDSDWVKDDNPKSKWPFLFPWMDLDKLPYTVLGPYLSKLVERAFVDGLHEPNRRPAADEWEDALVRTMDLLQPCSNPKCRQKWFVFDNAARPKCPFCGKSYSDPLPVLNLYRAYGQNYRPDNWRVMVFNGTRLYPWHAHPEIFPGEKLTAEQKKPLACFQLHKGTWYLRNEHGTAMQDLSSKKPIPLGAAIALKEGTQVLLDGPGSRMIHVQMANT